MSTFFSKLFGRKPPPPPTARQPQGDAHFCPGCGVAQQLTERYPWHFCNDCRRSATDGNGRALDFGNTHVSGGFYWVYGGEEVDANMHACRAVLCLIRARKAYVTEARMGGVVAQPVPGHFLASDERDVWDLTRAVPRPPHDKTPEVSPGRS